MAPLPAMKSYISTLLTRTAPSTSQPIQQRDDPTLAPTVNPSSGVTPPEDMHMKILFVLFGIIFAGFVITGIWFFFWAKNGGFYFKKDDWSEYKSTVLRRKGPHGTILSGATTETNLGGGSVVHGQKSKSKSKKGGARSVWGGKKKDRQAGKGRKVVGKERYKDVDYDEESELASAEMSEVPVQDSRLRGGDLASQYGESNMHSAVQEAMRSYRHEKPARVGGINKESEASTWDGSTGLDGSVVSGTSSEQGLLKGKQATPTNTPTKNKTAKKLKEDTYTGGTGSPKGKSGIRKVVSTTMNSGPTSAAAKDSGGFWSRKAGGGAGAATASSKQAEHEREQERIKAEAKKLQQKGRGATGGKRDFSFQAGAADDSTIVGSVDEEQRKRWERRRERAERREREGKGHGVPGSWDGSVFGSEVSGASEESGTKAYPHVIPGLSSAARGAIGEADAYKEEKRRARGYRREI